MSKKTIAIILIIALLAGCLVGGFFIYRYKANTIGKEKALEIAVSDSGLSKDAVFSKEVDYEKEGDNRYYEVEFSSGGIDYHYTIDAKTGGILANNLSVD